MFGQRVAVNLTESAVVYDGLPIASGGAHGLGRLSARDSLAAWLNFLDTRTESGPLDCFFDFPQTPEIEVEPAVAQRIEREFPQVRDRCPTDIDPATHKTIDR